MERLDVGHHKLIGAALVILIFVIGIMLGVQLVAAAGVEGVLVILFALALLIVAVLIVLFMKLVHVRDELAGRAVRVKVRK